MPNVQRLLLPKTHSVSYPRQQRTPLRSRSHTSVHRRPGVHIKRLLTKMQRCLSLNEARSPSLLTWHL
ncbi:hypothetical protein CKAH01_17477 [Colletotrichum kahawae]|uniref:Uncharacterized protein n=1 Tax=Colletotrichum kahawae TaxID=34407 RepID=A0AAD9Y9U8_COLKA|nr:hypothetical protein CKAH01_17477 [Colletotrichum kahawae]